MTMPEWYAIYEMHRQKEPVVGGITRGRLSDLEAWAEQVKAKRNGAAGNQSQSIG